MINTWSWSAKWTLVLRVVTQRTKCRRKKVREKNLCIFELLFAWENEIRIKNIGKILTFHLNWKILYLKSSQGCEIQSANDLSCQNRWLMKTNLLAVNIWPLVSNFDTKLLSWIIKCQKIFWLSKLWNFFIQLSN